MCQRANISSGHFQASRLISAALIVAGKQVGCITLNTQFRRFKTSIIHSPDQNAELFSSLSMRICAALQSPRSWLRQIITAPKPLLPAGLGNFFCPCSWCWAWPFPGRRKPPGSGSAGENPRCCDEDSAPEAAGLGADKVN